MREYLKNFWRNAFGEPPTFETMGRYSDIKERERAGNHDDPLPPPSPEPSCFAKGIAASLRDEPRQWEMGSWGAIAFHTTEGRQKVKLSVRHAETHTVLTWYDRWDQIAGSWGQRRWRDAIEYIVIDGETPNNVDTNHILSTIRAHPLGQYKEEVDRVKAEEARQVAAKAHFESLGCPPSP